MLDVSVLDAYTASLLVKCRKCFVLDDTAAEASVLNEVLDRQMALK